MKARSDKEKKQKSEKRQSKPKASARKTSTRSKQEDTELNEEEEEEETVKSRGKTSRKKTEKRRVRSRVKPVLKKMMNGTNGLTTNGKNRKKRIMTPILKSLICLLPVRKSPVGEGKMMMSCTTTKILRTSDFLMKQILRMTTRMISNL